MCDDEEGDVVRLVICSKCDSHAWCTRHDEATYLKLANQLRTAILEGTKQSSRTVSVQTDLVSGSKMGSFEVIIHKNVFFSKLALGYFPHITLLTERIVQYFKDLDDGMDPKEFHKRNYSPIKENSGHAFFSPKKKGVDPKSPYMQGQPHSSSKPNQPNKPVQNSAKKQPTPTPKQQTKPEPPSQPTPPLKEEKKEQVKEEKKEEKKEQVKEEPKVSPPKQQPKEEPAPQQSRQESKVESKPQVKQEPKVESKQAEVESVKEEAKQQSKPNEVEVPPPSEKESVDPPQQEVKEHNRGGAVEPVRAVENQGAPEGTTAEPQAEVKPSTDAKEMGGEGEGVAGET